MKNKSLAGGLRARLILFFNVCVCARPGGRVQLEEDTGCPA